MEIETTYTNRRRIEKEVTNSRAEITIPDNFPLGSQKQNYWWRDLMRLPAGQENWPQTRTVWCRISNDFNLM